MLLKVVNFLCRRAQCSKSNNELLNYSSWNPNQIFEFPMKIWSIDYAVSDKKCSSLKLHKSCNSELEYLTIMRYLRMQKQLLLSMKTILEKRIYLQRTAFSLTSKNKIWNKKFAYIKMVYMIYICTWVKNCICTIVFIVKYFLLIKWLLFDTFFISEKQWISRGLLQICYDDAHECIMNRYIYH